MNSKASGYHDWVHSPEEVDRYVDSFWQSEGIQPDKKAISYNAAKRSLANLCHKSMWGKFTERNDRSTTKQLRSPKNCMMFSTPSIEVMYLVCAYDNVV